MHPYYETTYGIVELEFSEKTVKKNWLCIQGTTVLMEEDITSI